MAGKHNPTSRRQMFAARVRVFKSPLPRNIRLGRRKMRFLALQCFSCRAMQVKQSKNNSNKWTCSICNEKQSLRKMFFSSDTAKDVRKFVQQANMVRGLTEEESAAEHFSSDAKENFPDCYNADQDSSRHPQHPNHSKWERFLPEEELSVSDEENDPTDSNYVTTLPDKKLRNSRPRSVHSSKRADRSLRNEPEPAPKAYQDVGFRDGDEEETEMAELRCGNFENGVGSMKDVELKGRSRKFVHPSHPRSSEPGAASKETGEGQAKRDYAALSQDSSRHEGSQKFKREISQCPPSKWSKYLDVEDG
ncbi:hypothetical protein R1sor_016754 [Riccia sorocarpa]|uniref:MRN complex-interacting protein N-terminal domain-containing protein n=1 Tax=Riccia sorocarpa TaxID=122646 RepID=A0ABD3HJH3_9MARC